MSLFLARAAIIGRAAAPGGFDPASLFAGGVRGGIVWPAQLSTLKQLSDGTGDITANGDPVGFASGAFGDIPTLVQAAPASRPTYWTSGSLHGLRAVNAGGAGKLKSGANLVLTGASRFGVMIGITVESYANAARAIQYGMNGWNPTLMIAAPVFDGGTINGRVLATTGGGVNTSNDNGHPAAPSTHVLTLDADLIAPFLRLYRDGVQTASSTSSTGGSDFGSATISLLYEADGGSPINGIIHAAVWREGGFPPGIREDAEAWCAEQSGITI